MPGSQVLHFENPSERSASFSFSDYFPPYKIKFPSGLSPGLWHPSVPALRGIAPDTGTQYVLSDTYWIRQQVIQPTLSSQLTMQCFSPHTQAQPRVGRGEQAGGKTLLPHSAVSYFYRQCCFYYNFSSLSDIHTSQFFLFAQEIVIHFWECRMTAEGNDAFLLKHQLWKTAG